MSTLRRPNIDRLTPITTIAAVAVALLFAAGCSDLGQPPASPDIPTIELLDAITVEGDSLIFVVQLDTPALEEVLFEYETSDSSASVVSGDYDASIGVGQIPPGESATVVKVATIVDTLAEPDETIILSIISSSGASIDDRSAVGTIIDGAPVSFSQDIRPILIFDGGCLVFGCHGGGSAQGDLNLGSGSYDTVIKASGSREGSFISPGNPDLSSLYRRTGAEANQFDRMPPAGPYLSEENLLKIRNWIIQGGLDN